MLGPAQVDGNAAQDHSIKKTRTTQQRLAMPRENVMRLLDKQLYRSCSASLAVIVLVFSGSIDLATAQTYPSRPVTLIVPYGAGGPTDTIGRIVADGMRTSLGQPIVIENVPGASGSIGVGRVARAAPDGYTFVIGGWSPNVLNGAMFSLSYDVLNDFQPISLVVDNPLVIVGRKTLPASDLKEFIAWLKANPDKASQGTSGAGGASHVAGVFFQKRTETQYRFVPYRLGATSAMQDLIGGQIDMLIDLAANSIPHVRSGNVRAFAVTARTRLAAAANIPTVDEAGLPEFYASFWHGLWAPRNTPSPIVAKLNAAVVNALSDPAVRQRLVDLGQEVFPRERQSPTALGAFQKAEIEKWWPIIRTAGIKAD